MPVQSETELSTGLVIVVVALLAVIAGMVLLQRRRGTR
jgi:preprotein translocase subunit SecG